MRIPAECHSDDHNVEIAFDALPWVEQASIDDLLPLAECGFKNEEAADRVAEFMETKDERISKMFDYLHLIRNDPMKQDYSGFECSVDGKALLRWLKRFNPHAYHAIKGAAAEKGFSI